MEVLQDFAGVEVGHAFLEREDEFRGRRICFVFLLDFVEGGSGGWLEPTGFWQFEKFVEDERGGFLLAPAVGNEPALQPANFEEEAAHRKTITLFTLHGNYYTSQFALSPLAHPGASYILKAFKCPSTPLSPAS